MIYLIGWENVYQRIDCRSVCQLLSDCEFWSWEIATSGCYTKYPSGWTRQRNEKFDSGDKSGSIDWPGYALQGGDHPCRKIIE